MTKPIPKLAIASEPARSISIPKVSLLGRGYLTRTNLVVGWAVVWRVNLVKAAISWALRVSLGIVRGSPLLDFTDRMGAFAVATVAGLLITDWSARRVARRRYRLVVDRFVGVAVIWREVVACLVWAPLAGLVTGAGLALIRLRVDESSRIAVAVGWLAILVPLVGILALGGTGWAVHRVLSLEHAKSFDGTALSRVATHVSASTSGESDSHSVASRESNGPVH